MAYIMIVDDDEDFASATAKALTDAGHEVRVVLETRGVIDKMMERPPALVILDVMFPEDPSAGFELARNIKQHDEKLENIPILMLTAINARFPLGFGPGDIDKCWLPVMDFLDKPVDLNVLTGKVSQLLRKGEAGAADLS